MTVGESCWSEKHMADELPSQVLFLSAILCWSSCQTDLMPSCILMVLRHLDHFLHTGWTYRGRCCLEQEVRPLTNQDHLGNAHYSCPHVEHFWDQSDNPYLDCLGIHRNSSIVWPCAHHLKTESFKLHIARYHGGHLSAAQAYSSLPHSAKQKHCQKPGDPKLERSRQFGHQRYATFYSTRMLENEMCYLLGLPDAIWASGGRNFAVCACFKGPWNLPPFLFNLPWQCSRQARRSGGSHL